eukprot:9567755-Alexandrium_andersonii.AAC.1
MASLTLGALLAVARLVSSTQLTRGLRGWIATLRVSRLRSVARRPRRRHSPENWRLTDHET